METNGKHHSELLPATGIGFYDQQLNGALASSVRSHQLLDAQAQLDLSQELALARAAASIQVKKFNDAYNAWVADPLDKRLHDYVTLTAELMHETQERVAKLVERVASIRKQEATYTQHDLKTVVDQLVRAMYLVCGQEYLHLAHRVKSKIDEQLKLPDDNLGTSLTPDRDVMDMDDSIPLHPRG